MAQTNSVYDPQAPEISSEQDSDKAFANLTNPEHFSKDGVSGDLGGSSAIDSGALKSAEESSGGRGKSQVDTTNSESKNLYNQGGSESGGRFKKFIRTNQRKKATISIIGILLGGGFFGLTIVSGPMQLIHLGQILSKSFSGTENSTSLRNHGLFRYAKTGNYGETRLGFLGSKVYGKSIGELKGIGIDFKTGTGSYLKSFTVDTNNDGLSKKYPEMKGMKEQAKIKFLADKLGVPEADIKKLSSGKFEVNTKNYSVKATRLLAKNSLALLDDGKIISAIKLRQLAKFYNSPSLFHPMEKLSAAAEKKILTLADKRKLEKSRQTKNESPLRQKIQDTRIALDKKLGSAKAKIGGALLITGATCTIKSGANEVIAYNNAAVLAPSILKATSAIALGSQIKTGQGFTSTQIGAAVDGLSEVNKDTGKVENVWQGEALQVLASNKQGGTDLPSSYKQLYSSNTTADKINSFLDTPALNALCSGPGMFVQLTAAAALIYVALPSGGSSLGVLVGAKVVGGTVLSMLVLQTVVTLMETSDIVPTVLSGPLGGNLLAYGSRQAANLEARSSGGIELTPIQSAALDNQSKLIDKNNFSSKSLIAKVFDVKDYRSLSGKFIDKISPSYQQNIANMLGTFTNLGTLLTRTFSSLLAGATAATEPYDWGFPNYGIPVELITNPAYADPYANADAVASILDVDDERAKKFITRASTCFGVAIQKSLGPDGKSVWDVNSVIDVYGTEDDYSSENCNDTSEPDWARIILFVFDTKTVKGASCYAGDSQSCSDLGQAT